MWSQQSITSLWNKRLHYFIIRESLELAWFNKVIIYTRIVMFISLFTISYTVKSWRAAPTCEFHLYMATWLPYIHGKKETCWCVILLNSHHGITYCNDRTWMCPRNLTRNYLHTMIPIMVLQAFLAPEMHIRKRFSMTVEYL